MAACRDGDTLVVTKLDRLARSLPDARAIADELTTRRVRLSLGGSVYDPTDPVGRLLFNVLAMVAEFEADLIRLRTKEGMRVAKAKGRLRGKQPKLNLARKRIWSCCSSPGSTAPPSSPICSASPGPPSTGRSGAASTPSPSDSLSRSRPATHTAAGRPGRCSIKSAAAPQGVPPTEQPRPLSVWT